MILRDVQAIALHVAEHAGGLFGNIGVARGKTLLSLLLPRVMNSRRAALLIPAAVKAQLLQKNYPALSEHFDLPAIRVFKDGLPPPDWRGVVVVTHSEVSDRRDPQFLLELKADLYVIDEAHAFCGASARSNRVYAVKRADPTARVCVMAGTLIDGMELDGAAGLARLTFGQASPFPLYKETVRIWGEGLQANKAAAGLERLCSPGETPRAAFRRRVRETLGVVTAAGRLNIPASLCVQKAPGLKLGAAARAALKRLRDEWVTPAGAELVDVLETYRHAIELSQGFCYRWAWPGVRDEEWLEARAVWFRAVRRKLQRPAVGMDSPGLLEAAAAEGRWVTDAYAPYAAVKDRPHPPTVADWVDAFLVDYAVEWGRKAPGIIWYRHTELGPAIAAAGGWPLYDGGAKCAEEIIEELGDRTIVASRPSHGTGLELAMFHRVLVTCGPSSAKGWEQLLGRHMRPAQRAARVEVDLCLHTPELVRSFEGALQEARALQETAPGAEHQLLLMADLAV